MQRFSGSSPRANPDGRRSGASPGGVNVKARLQPRGDFLRSPDEERRAVIIGGGVVGLAAARKLSASGWRVTVLERGAAGQEASSAAAGMIAPRLEFREPSPLLEMALEAWRLYPGFAADLQAETGDRIDLHLDGILEPLSPDGREEAGAPGSSVVAGTDLRELEPALAPGIERARFYPGEGSVDCRALVRNLLASVLSRGVRLLESTAAGDVAVNGGRVIGVRTGEDLLPAELVINCAGAWASRISVPSAPIEVHPIKGQMALLTGESGPRLPIYSSEVYIVPRSDGRKILGTTVEDRGFDKSVDPATVERLVSAARRLCPPLAKAELVDSWAGLRPRSASGEAPVIGALGPPGYFVAVGHFRNGILLAPLTAEILDAEVRSAARA